MKNNFLTVKDYLASLPEDRSASIAAVRSVIRKNLDKDLEEGIQYGMIGYHVPHRVYPAGYHCDPRQPLLYAALASQKNHMSLYPMSVYTGGVPDSPAAKHADWFRKAWAKTGKKLDMGKACIRFKKADDLALDVIGEAIRRVPAKKYLQYYEAALQKTKKRPSVARSTARKKAR